ncbi:MAG: S9 family peptidase [Tepidiformaceae bacterium]
MFGLWGSPVTAKSLAATLRLNEPCWDTDGRTVAWVEGRSDRGVIVVRQVEDGATRDLTSDISVRAFVGYGGGDFTLSHGAAYFVGQADQRIYRQPLAAGPATPITPAFGAAASPTVSPDGRWVAYVHTYEDVDCIAIVDSEGKHWPARFAEGRDFYMQPAWHPNGEQLSWAEWDHPNMPWDGCELKLANVAIPEGALPVATSASVVAGGKDVSVFQGTFSRDGKSLLYTSDESGWGHLYRRDLATGSVTQLTSGKREFGAAAWGQGQKRYAETAAGQLLALATESGFDRLVRISAGTEEYLTPALSGFDVIGHPATNGANEVVAVVASGGRQPAQVVVLDLAAEPLAPRVLRRSDSETVSPAALSQPQPISWTSFDGEAVHGIYYPPASEQFEGRGAPPLIVLVHGGPTSHYSANWTPSAQFFATRGYAVLLPNYRGSTGYGREYMLKLRESWGIYDVEDSKSGAQALADRGLADASRLVIMGGSAGGFTVLQSLCEIPGFYKAGISMFGVANQFTLASDTHKFEQRYLDSMLGPLPQAADVYRARSPIFHAAKIKDPLAVFQGEIDRVVPQAQSDGIVASLRSRGVPHEYHLYPGEGHGWRKSETIEQFYTSVEAFLKQYVLFG